MFHSRERIDSQFSGTSRVESTQGQAPHVIVVGGGIAGCSSALLLAERGVRVTLLERDAWLGGRAGAAPFQLSSGHVVQQEVGFHAFFRQYYNLRAVLRRLDPQLSFLTPLNDYPILAPNDVRESFAGLPKTPPLNLLALVARTPTITLREMIRFEGRVLWEMLGFDPIRTYATLDNTSARTFLDILGFPARARQMLFDVFSHSFFNPEQTMSAAEMVMMFHFYFMANPEGLVFDIVNRPLSHAIWQPMHARLLSLGVDVRLSTEVHSIDRVGARWAVHASADSLPLADAVVLATEVGGLRSIVSRSHALDHEAWRADVETLSPTRPYAVLRLWLDRPCAPNRTAFVGTANCGALDNISVYERFQDESAAWAKERNGSVIELHAYGVDPARDPQSVRDELIRGLHTLYPETASAAILDEWFAFRRDCPAFDVGSHQRRPGIRTPFNSIVLAGDFVRLDAPTALMERAATTGLLAANTLLERWSVASEPVWSIPRRGLVASVLDRKPWDIDRAARRMLGHSNSQQPQL